MTRCRHGTFLGAPSYVNGAVPLDEGRLSLAYTADVHEGAAILLSPLVETLAEVPLSAETGPELALLPGLKLSVGGWNGGAGVQLPLIGDGSPRVFAQVGYHAVWNRFLGDHEPTSLVAPSP